MRATAMNKRTRIIDSRTFETIGRKGAREDGPRLRSADLDEQELEHRRKEIHDSSPEGTPAHPGFTSAGVMMMIGGSMAMIVVISLVVFAVWGFAAGALTLVFGSALAFFGNPVIWAMLFRAEDIHEIEQAEHEEEASRDKQELS